MSSLRKIAISLATLIVILGVALFVITQSNFEDKLLTAQTTRLATTQTAAVLETTNAVMMTTLANTPQPSATATPAPPACFAKIIGGERGAYLQPSRGARPIFFIPDGSQVTIFYRLSDQAWWPIVYEKQKGWVRNDFITFEDTTCQLFPAKQLSELLPFPNEYEPVIDDTFAGNKYSWFNQLKQPITVFRPDPFGDFKLNIRATNKIPNTAQVKKADPTQIGNFELQISYLPEYYDTDGYMGFRYHINRLDNTYVEIRIHIDCLVDIYKVNQDIPTKIVSYPAEIPDEGESCRNDGIEDLLRLNVQNNILTGQINNLSIPSTLVNDPTGEFSIGDFELVGSDEIIDVYYVLITGK